MIAHFHRKTFCSRWLTARPWKERVSVRRVNGRRFNLAHLNGVVLELLQFLVCKDHSKRLLPEDWVPADLMNTSRIDGSSRSTALE